MAESPPSSLYDEVSSRPPRSSSEPNCRTGESGIANDGICRALMSIATGGSSARGTSAMAEVAASKEIAIAMPANLRAHEAPGFWAMEKSVTPGACGRSMLTASGALPGSRSS